MGLGERMKKRVTWGGGLYLLESGGIKSVDVCGVAVVVLFGCEDRRR